MPASTPGRPRPPYRPSQGSASGHAATAVMQSSKAKTAGNRFDADELERIAGQYVRPMHVGAPQDGHQALGDSDPVDLASTHSAPAPERVEGWGSRDVWGPPRQLEAEQVAEQVTEPLPRVQQSRPRVTAAAHPEPEQPPTAAQPAQPAPPRSHRVKPDPKKAPPAGGGGTGGSGSSAAGAKPRRSPAPRRPARPVPPQQRAAQAETTPVTPIDSIGVDDPDEGYVRPRRFRILPPGGTGRPGTLKDERRSLLRLRVATVSAVAVGIAAVSALTGYGISEAQRDAASRALTQADAQRFHLTPVDLPAMTAFGADYLRQCLTRYVAANGSVPVMENTRSQTVRAMSATGGDSTCTAVPTGSKPIARSVTSVVPAGYPSALEGLAGAYTFPFLVTTNDGLTSTMTVPLWAQNPDTGQGARVVGPIGITPRPQLGAPTQPRGQAERVEDSQLASALEAQFLPNALIAWVSTAPNLSQFLAQDATAAARAGLQGGYKSPTISSVKVYPDTPPPSGEDPVYTEGSTVTAEIVTDMQTAAGFPTRTGLRLKLVHTADKWFLRDVQGGFLNELPQAPSN